MKKKVLYQPQEKLLKDGRKKEGCSKREFFLGKLFVRP